nr:NADH dehydrogenase subunit 4L [Hypoponera sauteri]
MILDIILILNLCMFSLLLMTMVYKFMLMILMMMEFFILSISFMMYMVFSVMNLEIYTIYYIIFSVCESVLGLMILVLVIRSSGEEMYYSMNLFKFYDKNFFFFIFHINNFVKE